MKISRARLKQIIKEELGSVLGGMPAGDAAAEEPSMRGGTDHNLIYLIKKHRANWLPREWNDQAIKEDLGGAYSELMYAVGAFWNGNTVSQWYTGQERMLTDARNVVKKLVRRAERGSIKSAFSDIELITPEKKSPSALADTKLGKRFGLKSQGVEVNPFPDDEDDDL